MGCCGGLLLPWQRMQPAPSLQARRCSTCGLRQRRFPQGKHLCVVHSLVYFVRGLLRLDAHQVMHMWSRSHTGCTLAAFHCPAASAHHTQYAALQEERPQHGGFSVKYSLRSYAVWLVSHSLSNDDVHAQMHNYGAPVEPNRSVSSLHLRKRPSSSSRVSVTRSLARTGCSRPAVHVRNFGHQCRNADRR